MMVYFANYAQSAMHRVSACASMHRAILILCLKECT